MPAYEYEVPELDCMITLLRPVDRRDEPLRLVRKTVPDSVTIGGSAGDPFDPDANMRAGWRRLEERGAMPRDFSKKQVAQALALPPVL